MPEDTARQGWVERQLEPQGVGTKAFASGTDSTQTQTAQIGRSMVAFSPMNSPKRYTSSSSSRFLSGVLGHEAQSAHIDALLMAGRLADARTALSNLTLGTGARDRELRLRRGELDAETAYGKRSRISRPRWPTAHWIGWPRAPCRAGRRAAPGWATRGALALSSRPTSRSLPRRAPGRRRAHLRD
jgi:hypothetical protein